MGNGKDLRSVVELVDALYCNHSFEEESAIAAAVHLATFDLDYFGYILVQTWDCVESRFGDADVRWEYSLWYSGGPTKIKDFPSSEEGTIPFVAAAIAVEEHLKYVAEYTEEHDEMP